MGHQHRNDDNDENDLKNAFCRSNEMLQFNLDRMLQKYENMERSGKCSGVEIDLDGNVYYPAGMPRSQLDRILKRLVNRDENFGLSAFAAEDNSAEIFGKQFKQRLKECRKLDAEFDQRFKSKHPCWRPYTTPRKSRVERTVIRKTVKELTFENSVDYLNYLMKVKHIPTDLFKQQEIAYVNRMALPSTELEISQARPGRVARTIRSRSASPCTPTDNRTGAVTAPSSLMLLGDSCIRSRECSPVTGHLSDEDFLTTSQVKGSAPLMSLGDSCNRSRICSPSNNRLSNNDDFFASSAYQNSRATSKGMYQSSKANLEAENWFFWTGKRRLKDDVSAFRQKESHAAEPDGSPCTNTTLTKKIGRSPSVCKNDIGSASTTVNLDANPYFNGSSEQTEVPTANNSAITPSSKRLKTSTVESVNSNVTNSGKSSRKRKSSQTPTASKSRISISQKKLPQADVGCSTAVASPPNGGNQQATPKFLLVDSNATRSGKNSRKRKSPQTPAAPKSRINNSKKQSLEGSTGNNTEALPSKKTKTKATPKALMSADSSGGSNVNASRSRKRNLSHSQQTPPMSRHNAQKQPSTASTSSTSKKGKSTTKSQTPHVAESTSFSKNEASSFETPKVVKSQKSASSGSKSKKRTSKTPRNVETQPSAKRSSKKSEKEEEIVKVCLVRSPNVNISAVEDTSTLSKQSREIPLHIEGSKNKKVVPLSAKVTAKAQRKLRSTRKTFTPGTTKKPSKKSKISVNTSRTKNGNGKRKFSAKVVNEVISRKDTMKQSNQNGDLGYASAILLQSPSIHKSSLVPFNSQKLSASKKPEKSSDGSDFERVVTPLNGEPVAFSFWNGNVNSVVQSYDHTFANFGKPSTILGFDAGDVRRNCQEDAQQSTLSAFLSCARKYSLSEAESVSVDEAMKEDRRAMAAARNRNRQLISGYYV
ncbi:unnamed protein product [Cylicocyclus nassatus]|uniref:Uncharacterized protein n=1 Tax=Cylicocyclus nassatus TaxID=53992 RepID=A0AA36DS51_CYLNA|nr:unnamed protein product [Cylicocyclus nassatus]